MKLDNQKVVIKYDPENLGNILGQSITQVVVDGQIAAGLWNGKQVFCQSLAGKTWALYSQRQVI